MLYFTKSRHKVLKFKEMGLLPKSASLIECDMEKNLIPIINMEKLSNLPILNQILCSSTQFVAGLNKSVHNNTFVKLQQR